MNDLGQWLESHGLGKYLDLFAVNEITFSDLRLLTDEDVKELGLPLGPRRRLLAALEGLRSEAAIPSNDAPAPLAPDPSAVADRRQLTIMFADLVGSTRLSTVLEAEDLRELNRDFQEQARAAIEQFGGFVARYMGDGVLAYFGYPLAHEEDAERAVRAGLELTERLAEMNASTTVLARIGIATGQVIVGDLIGEGASRESAAIGETPNLAARLQGVAEPGSLVIDEVTHSIAAPAFETVAHTSTLKGFSAPIRYWRVVGEGQTETRFDARTSRLGTFVGRSHEVGLLLERWESTTAGEGQVALVSGEPGIGKSRLSEELHRRIGVEQPHTRLRYQCSPFHTLSPFYPIVAHLNHAAALLASDPPSRRLDKIERLFAAGDDEAHALIAELLSIPQDSRYTRLQLTADVQKQRTVRVLVQQLLHLASDRPVLFVLEDAHWVDPSTHDLIREVITATAHAKVMIVITHRPDWHSGIPEQPRLVTIPLSRLVTRQATDLVASVTTHAMPDEVIGEIVERAEGVPLFIEELTRSMMERAPGPGLLDVPATLQASLAERIDRLGADRDMAQAAAVIGREFEPTMLADVLQRDEKELLPALHAMLEIGLIHQKSSVDGERYVWKHALVQDVAYGSLLRDQRRSLHLRTAQVLEARSTESVAIEAALLAHHYRAANQPQKSARYWLMGARTSLARAASEEIIAQASNALSDLEKLHDGSDARVSRSQAYTLIGEAMMASRGFAAREVKEPLETALALARETQDLAAEFEALRALGPHLLSASGGAAALKGASRMLEISGECEEDKMQATSLDAAGTAHFLLGDQRSAETALEAARLLVNRAEYDQFPTKGGADIRIPLHGYLSYVLALRGKVDRSTSIIAEGLDLARQQSHPVALAWALAVSARVCLIRGELTEAERMLDEAIEVCDQHGLLQRKGHALALRGRMLLRSGRAREGLAEIEAGLAHWRQGGTVFHTTEYLADGAEAHLALGNVEAARRWLDEAGAVERSHAEMFNAAERERLLARCQRLDGDRAGALDSLERAASRAREQGAHLFELRACIDLVGAHAQGPQEGAAKERLSMCMASWAQGGPVPELQEGRRLLG
jgi:predicted ATPase